MTTVDTVELIVVLAVLAALSVGVGFLFGLGGKIAERLWLYIVGVAAIVLLVMQGAVLIVLGLARPGVFGKIDGLRRTKDGFVVIGTFEVEQQDHDDGKD
ncbi:MAG: hypothetical protein V6Z86_05980 [Hyphomicrobiales bacterium]